jgi:hypothetical protein
MMSNPNPYPDLPPPGVWMVCIISLYFFANRSESLYCAMTKRARSPVDIRLQS